LIDFGSLGGQPVCALFSPVNPTVRTHLHPLSRLSFALHDRGFKALITPRAPREEILCRR
jgi:PTS system nitrogen regulatory IIA component